MASASSSDKHIGFSHITCLPARSAATEISWWVKGGVRTNTASSESSAKASA